MPKCPKCKAEIDYLIEWSPEWTPYEFRVDENGENDWEGSSKHEAIPMDMDDKYDCPECGEQVCVGLSNAEKFLKEGS